MQISCPHCGTAGNAPDSVAGQTLKCPRCQKSFVAGGGGGGGSGSGYAPTPAPAPAPIPVPQPMMGGGGGGFGDVDARSHYDEAPSIRREGGGNVVVDFIMGRIMIMPYILVFLLFLGIILCFVSGILAIANGGIFIGLGMIFLGPIMVRVMFEAFMMMFNMVELLRQIRDKP